jgi:hypothetical protein
LSVDGDGYDEQEHCDEYEQQQKNDEDGRGSLLPPRPVWLIPLILNASTLIQGDLSSSLITVELQTARVRFPSSSPK